MSLDELQRVVIELINERQELVSQNEALRESVRVISQAREEHANRDVDLRSENASLGDHGEMREASQPHEELRQAQELAEGIINSSSQIILVVDPTGRIVRFNEYLEKLTDWSLDEVQGRDWRDIFVSDDDRQQFDKCFPSGVQSGTRSGMLGNLVTRGGKIIEIEWRCTPLDTSRGDLFGYVCTGVNVSEILQSKQRLHESESRLAAETAALARLNEASTKLWRARDLQSGLKEILFATIDLLNADAGLIQLYDPSKKVLKIAAHQGLREEFLRRTNDSPTDENSASSQALRSGQRVMINDLQLSEDDDTLFSEGKLSSFRSIQSTPLISGTGEILGVCSTFFREPMTAEVEQLRRFDLYLRQGVEFIERQKSDELLRDREERMAAVLEAAADAIITIDNQGIIEEVNSATESMFGYSRDELIGQNVSMLMPSPYREDHDGYIARYVETRVPHIIGSGREVFAVRKNGATFPVGLSVSEVDHKGLFTGILRDNSERHTLQREVLRIADEEQGRIGQDLHDSTQQELAGLGMLAHSIRDRLLSQFGNLTDDRSKELIHLVDRMIEGISRTHREVQVISRGLVALSIDPQSLMHALRNLAARVDELDGTVCGFKCEVPVLIRNNEVATHLFRIAQEAVTNALKHAKPEHLLISLESRDGFTELRIADDGSGFDPQQVTSGLGLKTMHYRASLIGAQISITPVETGGTLVTCQVWD